MKLKWGQREAVEPFVSALCGFSRGFGNCVTAAVVREDNEMIAGLVFHNWSPETGVIEVSAASVDRRWAQRGILRAAFDYIFRQLGCQMAIARTKEGNTSVRRLWRALGATEYMIPRLGGRTASEAILTLTEEAWYDSRFME